MSQTLGTILGTILVTILVTILAFPMKFGSYGVVVAGANRSVTLMVDAVQKLRWFVHETEVCERPKVVLGGLPRRSTARAGPSDL